MKDNTENIKIGKYDIPKNLIDAYIKESTKADKWLKDKNMALWNVAVKTQMVIHRSICEKLSIDYGDVEFYEAFHKYIDEQTAIKG